MSVSHRNDLSQDERVQLGSLVPLGGGRTLTVGGSSENVTLQVRSASADGEQRCLEIEVHFTAEGPALRVRAHSVEVAAADHVSTRCETFSVHARQRIELRSQGTIEQSADETARVAARHVELDASPGAVHIKANDEVQLLGEMILLNCDRPMSQPAWVPAPPEAAPRVLALGSESGDPELIRALLES